MTLPDLILTILFAAIFVVLIFFHMKKFRQGENCCGYKTVKVKKKRLRRSAGSFTLKVEGMHCESCCRAVTEAVNSLAGHAAKVDLLTKKCKVTYEKEPETEEVIKRIQSMGYEADILDFDEHF